MTTSGSAARYARVLLHVATRRDARDVPTVRPDDPYHVLQVDPVACVLVIQAAYRALARIFHPDAGGDPEQMKRINAAWEVLGDPARRKRYDDERLRSSLAASESGQATEGSAGRVIVTPAPVAASPVDEHAGPPQGPAFGPVLTFGRYEGWTMGQVARYDRRFLEWLRTVPAGRSLRDDIDAALEGRGAPLFGYRRHDAAQAGTLSGRLNMAPGYR